MNVGHSPSARDSCARCTTALFCWRTVCLHCGESHRLCAIYWQVNHKQYEKTHSQDNVNRIMAHTIHTNRKITPAYHRSSQWFLFVTLFYQKTNLLEAATEKCDYRLEDFGTRWLATYPFWKFSDMYSNKSLGKQQIWIASSKTGSLTFLTKSWLRFRISYSCPS